MPRFRHLAVAVVLAASALVLGPSPSPAATSLTIETRIAGTDRYSTANALALAAAVARGSGNTRHVVVVSGVTFPDGLSAAALAGATDAVMLLTPPDGLPASVVTTIGSLRSSDGLANAITSATIVGGEAAVGANVRRQLENLGLTVTRVDGANRYETSNNVAREAHRLSDTGIGTFDGSTTVFLATGENFPDSLAASSWSYRNNTPVLLTTGRSLDATTRETIELLGARQVLLLGGTTAVSPDVESALSSVPGVTTVRRIQGADRFATAAAISSAIGEHDPDYVTRALFVSGSSFPDALASAPFAGQDDSYAVIPVGPSLPAAVSAWISRHASTLTAIRAIGGSSAVPSAVLDTALGREPVLGPGAGFTSVFMGHSFFQPPASRLEWFARSAGIAEHQQSIVFAGGSSGAPEAMWADTAKRAEIRALLARGDVDLLGMTYHPDYPTIRGYRSWVDEALSHNPRTAFFVGMPWLLDPASMTPSVYAATWQRAYDDIVSPIIDQLRAAYPTNTFFAIPYGRAAAVLYQLFDEGRLPGVTDMFGDPRQSLFRDSMGHGGNSIDELAGLVWLRSIYCVDLTGFRFDTGYSADLRAYAMAIVDQQNPDHHAPWCEAS